MKRISAVHVGLFLILCLLFSSAVAEDRPKLRRRQPNR